MTGAEHRTASLDPDHRLSEAQVRHLFEVHYGRLAGWAARLVGDEALGHDLATEAFVRLLRQRTAVDEPRAWLYAVTTNLVRDHWRARGREESAFRRLGTGRFEQVESSDIETALTVRELVQALPDRLRAVVVLHYYAELPVASVAAHLGKSEGAVKRDLFDARRRMAVVLGETS